MNEEPALVPTSFGPIGVMTTLPEGPPRAAALLLKGNGPARFGNSLARMARALASSGIAVLRLDYPGQGDSTRARGSPQHPLPAVREVLEWYRDRQGRRDVVLLGSCYGGRLAATLGADDDEVGGLVLLVPYPWALRGGRVRRALRMFLAVRLRRRHLDTRFVGELRSVAVRAPVWIITGEGDGHTGSLRSIARRMGAPGLRLRLEVVPGAALHAYVTPGSDRDAWSRIADAILAMVPARSTA